MGALIVLGPSMGTFNLQVMSSVNLVVVAVDAVA